MSGSEGMTLRKRIGLITGAFLIAGALMTHGVHRGLFIRHIQNVDRLHLSNNLETCRKGIEARMGDLAMYVRSAAVDRWARATLKPEAPSAEPDPLPGGGIADWLCAVDVVAGDTVVWSVDPKTGDLHPDREPWSLPMDRLTGPLPEGETGLVLLDENPPMLIARRVLLGDDEATTMGVLLAGRFLSEERLRALAGFSGLSLQTRIIPVSPSPGGGVVEADDIYPDPSRSNTLSGAMALVDVTGRQAMILEGGINREASRHPFWLVSLAWLVELGALLLLVSVTVALLLRGVIRPLEALNRSVVAVTEGRCDSIHRLTDGVPEIRRLAEATDRMLQESRVAERSLQISEQRLRTAQRIARMGYWERNFESGELVWSPEVYEIFGLSPGAFAPTRQAFLQRIPPEERDLVDRQVMSAIEKGERYHLDHRIILEDGSIRHVHENAEIQYDDSGKPCRMLGVVMDITERRAIEDERARLAVALDQATDHILVLSPDLKISYVNPAFSSATGFSRFELVGRDIRDIQNCDPCGGERHPLWTALAQGVAWSGQIVNRRKDGKPYHVEVSFSPVRDSADALSCFVSVQRDITASLHLEKQLRQSQKMEAVGQLAGGVAHDFNNLLQAISGYADMALEEAPDDSHQRSSITQIIKAADKAASLVRQLLSFSRQQTIHPNPIDMNALIQDMAQILNRVLGANVTLRLKLAQDGAWVHADASQMEQVLMNLCVNARDAMPDGGVITVATEPIVISEEYRAQRHWIKEGRYVLLTLSDTGTGISEEALEHIFEPFFTTKEAGKGTGMGLATVYGILKRHNGFIDVKSAPGQGTTFQIFLPPGGKAAGPLATPPLASPAPGGSETILLAEDDELVRSLASSILTRAGYTVLEARDGEEAVALFHQRRDSINLALLDLIMPKRNGQSVYDEIRKTSPDLPVLFCTGYTSHVMDNAALSGEEVECVQKPFSPATLLEKVRKHLNRGA